MAGGRPKKDLDITTFEGLCKIQCTKDEMCDVFDVNEQTLTRWCMDTYEMSFCDVYKKKSASGKASLRRSQFKMAETNPTMAIWLGKQYLGQADKIENTNTNTITASVDFSHLTEEQIKRLIDAEEGEK